MDTNARMDSSTLDPNDTGSLPWEAGWEPDDPDVGSHEWLGATPTNGTVDPGEAA